MAGGGAGAGSMWRFYTGDDSPGIKMYVTTHYVGGVCKVIVELYKDLSASLV